MKYETKEFAVGWFTLAFINAGLAQGKNRSGLAWFLASIFIGPIATFLIVVLDREAAPPPAGVQKKEFKLQDFRQ